MTREEILDKYPFANNNKTETVEEDQTNSKAMEQYQMMCGPQPYPGPNES